MRLFTRLTLLSALAVLIAAPAFAQTTATLIGSVTSDGAPLPGATITISSPALQGVRTTASGPNGDYSFAALPPGRYDVTFELQGLSTVKQTVALRLAETTRADADLKVAKVAESITVTASAPSILETPQVSTSLTKEQIDALPVGRTIAQRIQIAPGINNDGPNQQASINGAPSYDNLYMVNGVVVNDTVRGQPENLFIEDAIQETTLLTGGVSAEWGRFTGGVVNTITKSGGNTFSGSFRDSITNPSWTKVTDFKDPISGIPQPANISKRSNQYEATLGGFLLKDRLWFFGAGRKFNQEQSRVTVATNIPFLNSQNNKRYEGKLTGQITPKHSLVASYLHNITNETNNSFGNIVDLRSLSNRQLPNWLETAHYSGVLTNSLLLEAQYSRRYFAFVGGGGPKDLINGTLLRDNATFRRMWAPTFCGECDPKTRNNKDYLGKVNYFLSTKSLGSHNLVAGYDAFHELRHENNYQSGSDFRIWGDFIYVGDQTFFHADPTSGFIEYTPIAQLSKTSDAAVKSVFANDKWDLSNHWSLNIGVRYDKNDAVDQSRNKTSDDSAVSPRLGVIYDVRGDGRNRITASYAQYVSHIDNGVNDNVAVGGQPGSIYFNYRGPEINAPGTPASQLVPTDQVIKRMFDWFNSVGGVTGYKDIATIFIPGLSGKLNGSLKSPNAKEYALGYGRQIGSNGYVRGDLIHRTYGDFYTSRTDTTTGQNVDANGNKVDVTVFENSSGGLSRRYNGVQLQGAYRLRRLNLGGNYTYSTLKGNVEGETFNNATVTAGNDDYPEYTKFAQNIPVGYLNEDIRHRINVYGNYEFPLPWGSLNLGVLERYHSGAPYSAVGRIKEDGVIPNPNGYYATPPPFVNYFFSGRGAFRLDNISETSFTGQYTLPTFGKVNIFLRGDLVNPFNQQGVEFAIGPNVLGAVVESRVYTAKTAPRSTLKAGVNRPNCTGPGQKATCSNPFYLFNPYTDTPIEYKPGMDPNGHYNYMLDPTFGQPTNKEAYQLPRTYRFAVGIRF
jgi:carboxypeptidase family protein/TonB-dependent receptor-like protein